MRSFTLVMATEEVLVDHLPSFERRSGDYRPRRATVDTRVNMDQLFPGVPEGEISKEQLAKRLIEVAEMEIENTAEWHARSAYAITHPVGPLGDRLRPEDVPEILVSEYVDAARKRFEKDLALAVVEQPTRVTDDPEAAEELFLMILTAEELSSALEALQVSRTQAIEQRPGGLTDYMAELESRAGDFRKVTLVTEANEIFADAPTQAHASGIDLPSLDD